MTEVLIYGEVGSEVTPSGVINQLAQADGDVTVRISSPGGDVYAGLAIMNALRAHPGTVTAVIEGLAASAASFIAIGGAHRVIMRPTAELMIHEAASFVGGSADDLTKTSGDLERISGNLAGIYASKAGGEASRWRAAMKAETWFSADEALTAGLIDAVEDARISTHAPVFNLAGTKYKNRAAAPPPPLATAHSGHKDERSHDMAFRADIAHMLGVSTDASETDVKAALTKVLNEQIEVTSTVDISYPTTAEVVPTGDVTITPDNPVPAPSGDQPALTFEVTKAPNGWDAEIDETGTLLVAAPAGAQPDSTEQVTIKVTGNGSPVEFTIDITVVAAANPKPDAPTAPDAPAAPTGNTVTLDQETFRELQAAAKLGWEAKNRLDEKNLEDEVDRWITEGRINSSRRSKVIADMKANPESARGLYGSNPKNTVPRQEIGHGRDMAENDSVGANALESKLRGVFTRKNFH